MFTGDELGVFLASILAEKFSKISLSRAFEGFWYNKFIWLSK